MERTTVQIVLGVRVVFGAISFVELEGAPGRARRNQPVSLSYDRELLPRQANPSTFRKTPSMNLKGPLNVECWMLDFEC